MSTQSVWFVDHHRETICRTQDTAEQKEAQDGATDGLWVFAILHRLVETALWDHARIRINQGKTQCWNRAGVFPVGCEYIVEAGRRASPPVVVWRGDQSLPTSEQGIRVLGAPFGHSDHVTGELRSTNEEHSTLLSTILAVRDLQCAWLLLLFCAAARANYLLRVLPPSQSETFATVHDSSVWNCLRLLLDIPGTPEMLDRAGLSLTNGGLGLRSAMRDNGECVLGKLGRRFADNPRAAPCHC